jgi:hypothetical protein
MTSTTLFVFSTLVLIATGFVATWRVKRGAGWRLSKPGTRASAPDAARRPARPGQPAEADKREPFMAPAADGQVRAAMPALPSRPPRPQAAPSQAEPGSGPNPGAGSALYIGSVNLTPPRAPAKRATQPAQPGVGTKRPAIESRTSQALAEDFMQWLRDGMATRTLQINTPQSALHFTDTDMVLVYPSIFQAYANACAAPAIKGPAPTTSAERIQAVLDAVCSLGWHESGPFDSRLLHFELLQQRAEPSILKGVLIQSPQRFINPLPPPNPALSRLI